MSHDTATHLARRGRIDCRVWAMPAAYTFDCPPIAAFVRRYLTESLVSIDPFSGARRWATYNNDLDPDSPAESHQDARDFLDGLAAKGVRCDLAILDPPYSPRQITEVYRKIGRPATMMDTQNGRLYGDVKERLARVLTHGAIVLSFGWNSAGMGLKHGAEIEDLLLVCHGAAHNDTICLAERIAQSDLFAASVSPPLVAP